MPPGAAHEPFMSDIDNFGGFDAVVPSTLWRVQNNLIAEPDVFQDSEVRVTMRADQCRPGFARYRTVNCLTGTECECAATVPE